MARDVNMALENIAKTVGGFDEKGAKTWIKSMRAQSRYLEDIWS